MKPLLAMTGNQAHHPVDSAHALEVILCQISESNILQEILLPSLHTAINTDRDIPLLADHTAEAALFVAGCNVCQSIRQIVELALVKHLLGHMVLEPQDLGDLHLNGHLATDIAQQVVVGRVNLRGLLNRAVIQPENDIAVRVKARPRYRDRLVRVGVEDRQGARGVESNAADGVRVDIVLADGALYRGADAPPNVGRGLFLEAAVSSCLTSK